MQATPVTYGMTGNYKTANELSKPLHEMIGRHLSSKTWIYLIMIL